MQFDCVIATDAASFERLGTVGACVGARKLLINIDHHTSNTRYGDINWVAAREPSTGELIYRLLRAAKWPVTRQIADCLFTAVSTDTGSFQYATTRPGTYHVAGELVRRGANLAKICDEVYQSYPLSRVHLLRHVYNHFHLTDNDRIGYFWLKKADFSRTGAESADSEGLIDHIRAIAPVVVACVFEEIEPELTRISLRSKSEKVNVNEVAAHFGGGGHPAAAGARIPGRPMSVQRQVIAAIRKALKAAGFRHVTGLFSIRRRCAGRQTSGQTSHDVVDAIRRQFGIKKVGHCGTLDPNATGLLIIVLGRGTKLSERLMSEDKVYEARFGSARRPPHATRTANSPPRYPCCRCRSKNSMKPQARSWVTRCKRHPWSRRLKRRSPTLQART
jgi:phosphoesterase RecJ-like protein